MIWAPRLAKPALFDPIRDDVDAFDYWANRHLPLALSALKSVRKAVAVPFKALR